MFCDLHRAAVGGLFLLLIQAVPPYLACDDIVSTPYGELTSPNYPNNYPSEADCFTTVVAPEGSQLLISFFEFQTESCKYDFLKIYPVIGGNPENTKLLCEVKISPPDSILSLNNNVTFHFHSDKSTEFKGFRLEWKVVDKITYHAEPKSWLDASDDCSAAGASLVKLDDGTQRQITDWITSLQNLESVANDTKAWTDTYFTPWVWLKGCFKPTRTMSEENVEHFKLNSWTVCLNHCAKTNYFALQGDKCICLDQFEGEFLDPEDNCQTECRGMKGGVCGGKETYTVYMNDICFGNSSKWMGTVAQTISGNMCQPWTTYFNSSYDSLFPDSSVQSASNYCRDPEGTGSLWCFAKGYSQYCDVPKCAKEDVSDDAPSTCIQFTYDDNTVKTIQVACSKRNNYINLQIVEENGMETLQYDNGSDHFLLSWKQAWASYTTLSRWNTGHFVTDYEVGPYWRGFTRARVHSSSYNVMQPPVDCGTVDVGWFTETGSSCDIKLPYFCQHATVTCGETFLSHNGTFQSPGYPLNYTSMLYCRWEINVEPGYYVTLGLEFDIEQSYACQNDYIRVYDGNSRDSSVIDTWCGHSSHTVTSTGNQLVILFRTDKTLTNKGFVARWTTGSRSTTGLSTGVTVTSPIMYTSVAIGGEDQDKGKTNISAKLQAGWIFTVTVLGVILNLSQSS